MEDLGHAHHVYIVIRDEKQTRVTDHTGFAPVDFVYGNSAGHRYLDVVEAVALAGARLIAQLTVAATSEAGEHPALSPLSDAALHPSDRLDD